MTTFSAGTMQAIAWAKPNIDQDAPDEGSSVVRGSAVATGLEHPWYAITIEWQWPIDAPWTQFCIVRSIRSPVKRTEEGQILVVSTREEWDHFNPETGNPIFEDPQPPPDEWVFYTIFCLDINRVWVRAGHVHEIGPGDHDWTLRLPELLPGASVNDGQGVIDPAQQSNDLVQFLQSPAGFLDRAVSMAETMQYFWDPLRCPPHMVKHLAFSWGYGTEYSEVLGIGRIRHILRAITYPTMGSLNSIRIMATASTGCIVDAAISHNLMLDVNDSSFESGDIYDSGWEPVYLDPLDEATKMEVRSTAGLTITLPENVLHGYYLYIPSARTIQCGSYTSTDPYGERILDGYGHPVQVFDPIACGIPVSGWKNVRMGIHAHHGLSQGLGGSTTLEMGINLYDYEGIFIQSLTVLQQRIIHDEWAEYWNGDGKAGDDNGVVIPQEPPNNLLHPDDWIIDPSRWEPSPHPDHETPQNILPVAQTYPDEDAMLISWDPAASGMAGIAAWVTPCTAMVPGAEYLITVRANAPVTAAQWRAVVVESTDAGITWDRHIGPTVTPDESNDTSEFTLVAAGSDAKVGIEVLEGGGWASAGQHAVTQVAVRRIDGVPAYGVPWITVGDACSIDLVVVDDGENAPEEG